MNVHEQSVDAVVGDKRREAEGNVSLFGEIDATDFSDLPAIPVGDEWQKSVLLAFEREMLGLYVSDHPLLGVEHVLAGAADMSIASLMSEGASDGQTVTLAGILSSVSRRITKAGAPWAQAILEDLEGSVEVLFFPATYQQVGINIAEDAIVVVRGRTDARDDTVKVIAAT